MIKRTKYAGIKYNDVVDGDGIIVSLWTQGCPFKCKNCHNPQTWDENGGLDIPSNLKEQIIEAITANGIQRNFSVLGGEPLAPYNQEFVLDILTAVREAFPHIKIYLWTGYTLENLKSQNSILVNSILDKIDILIDGPFIEKEKDLTLELRGSRNQRILYKNIDF